MRQIGTLPTVNEARLLSDHLESLGMATRLIPQADGCAVWVIHEDHVAQARQELEAFAKNPDDPRYQSAARAAQGVRRQAEQLDRKYRKNVRDLSGRWDSVNFQGRPLTVSIIAVCIAVYIATWMGGWGHRLHDKLLLTSYTHDERGVPHPNHLRELAHGEAWRIVTPIFLHSRVNPLHIVFNMGALLVFGTMIEYCRGWRTLAALIFLSAVASNLGQYAYMVNFYPIPLPFGGMSGVIYALFGYVWIKSLYEPEQGMRLHPRAVWNMLLWLVLCMTGFIGPIANAAHVVGLVVGVLYGLARF